MPMPLNGSMNLLVLYDDQSSYIGTVHEYLEAFRKHSRQSVQFATATQRAACPHDLNGMFDAILITYSVRLAYDWHLATAWAEAIAAFRGPKLVTIQDEYDHTEVMRRWVKRLGIHHVFTCVPDEYIDVIYGTLKPDVGFSNVLTGYASPADEDPVRFAKRVPLRERKTVIGYRGRSLAWYYGDLAREKLIIGQRMHEECQRRGVAADIAWNEEKRIYGDAWPAFIGSCRATLASESGANVFDDHGAIRAAVEAHLKSRPRTPYEEIHALYLAAHDGTRARMNQVSPRIFESVALGTALVLFEGTYSGVVEPDRHFIPLKKDFSNLDEVFRRLDDLPALEAMTERAFADVIVSGRWSYRTFVAQVDAVLERLCPRPRQAAPLMIAIAPPGAPRAFALDPYGAAGGLITNMPVHADDRARLAALFQRPLPLPPLPWHRRCIPQPIHRCLQPVYKRLCAMLGRG